MRPFEGNNLASFGAFVAISGDTSHLAFGVPADGLDISGNVNATGHVQIIG